MNSVRPIENLYAAVWKSAATEVVARQLGLPGDGGQAVAAHPIVVGTDKYCAALSNGEALPAPRGQERPRQDSDPEIAAYLAQLHHRLIHNKCTVNDPRVQADIAQQLKRFTFGNPLWQQMSQQYYDYYATYPFHAGQSPHYRAWNASDGGRGNPDFGVIEWRLPANAVVAIVGDIGTGTDIAAATLMAALSFKPDAILHVGDVYFSGTRFEFAHRFIGLIKRAMAAARLTVPFFTVPGNHEYFTGNIAFFECLDSGELTPLSAQRQQASYFCLKSADDGWQFLGMDTGYYGHYLAISDDQQRAALKLLHNRDPRTSLDLPIQKLPPNTDMVLLRDDEAQWHCRLIETFVGQSILFSHHPLYSATVPCGIAQRMLPIGTPDISDINRLGIDTAIWRQLGRYFGDKIPAWFWGHEHSLNIFEDSYRPADWPKDPDVQKLFRALPKGRCVGHSAIPVAVTENPYARNFPVPLKPSTELGVTDGWYNHGFEILRLASAGKPAHASYYQIVRTDPKPVLLYEEDIGGRANTVASPPPPGTKP